MIDWENCPGIESVPGKLGGAWVFTDSRLPVSALFGNLEAGATIQEFMGWFHPVDEWKVKAVLEFVVESLWTSKSSMRILFDHNTPRPLRRYLA